MFTAVYITALLYANISVLCTSVAIASVDTAAPGSANRSAGLQGNVTAVTWRYVTAGEAATSRGGTGTGALPSCSAESLRESERDR